MCRSKNDRACRGKYFAVKKWMLVGLAVAWLLIIGGGVAVWRGRDTARLGADQAKRDGETKKILPPVVKPRVEPVNPPGIASAGERMARADKIRRDYDEMTTKFSADYSAAGNAFPGGLSAYLKQLALLQREKHKDLAAILTPAEL